MFYMWTLLICLKIEHVLLERYQKLPNEYQQKNIREMKCISVKVSQNSVSTPSVLFKTYSLKVLASELLVIDNKVTNSFGLGLASFILVFGFVWPTISLFDCCRLCSTIGFLESR